jgi:NADPH-dependent glutamate synthase beta subunit-like oxidoreductase
MEAFEFHWLTAPVQFIGDEEGRLQAIECVRMEMGEPDKDGREAASGIDEYLRNPQAPESAGAKAVTVERGKG